MNIDNPLFQLFNNLLRKKTVSNKSCMVSNVFKSSHKYEIRSGIPTYFKNVVILGESAHLYFIILVLANENISTFILHTDMSDWDNLK